MALHIGAVIGSIRFDVGPAIANVQQFNRTVQQVPQQARPAGAAMGYLGSQVRMLGFQMLATYASIMTFQRGLRGMVGLINQGIGSIDEMSMRAAGMAAMMQQMYPEAPFERVLKLTTILLPKIERMDEVFSGTGEQLMMMADAMVKFGMASEVVKLVTDESGKTKENFIAMAEAIKAQTAGQNFQMQLMQEIRALGSGRMVRGAALLRLLVAQNKEIAKQIPMWIKQGELLQNIAPYLEGFVKSADEVAKLLSTQKATWETIVKRILRMAFLPAYEDMVTLQVRINSLLFEASGELTRMGETVVVTLVGGWESVKLSVEAIYEIYRGMHAPLIQILTHVYGIAGNWEDTLKFVLEVIAAFGELGRLVGRVFTAVQKTVELMLESVTEFANFMRDPWSWQNIKTLRGYLVGLPEELKTPLEEALGVPKDLVPEWQQAWADIFKPSERYLEVLEGITKLSERPPLPPTPGGIGDPRREEDDATNAARVLEARVQAATKAYEQISQLEEWSIQERIDGLERLMEREKAYYDGNVEARRAMLLKIKALEDAQRAEREAADQAMLDSIEMVHQFDYDTGLVSHEAHIDWLRAQQAEHERYSEDWIAREKEIRQAEDRIRRLRLAQLDEEIARTGVGYGKKLEYLREILRAETDIQAQLMLQGSIRTTLSDWLTSDMSLLYDVTLTLEQQRDILIAIVEKWEKLGTSALPRLKAQLQSINLLIEAQGVTLKNAFWNALDAIERAFQTFFEDLMSGVVDFGNLFLSVIDAIKRELAGLMAKKIILWAVRTYAATATGGGSEVAVAAEASTAAAILGEVPELGASLAPLGPQALGALGGEAALTAPSAPSVTIHQHLSVDSLDERSLRRLARRSQTAYSDEMHRAILRSRVD